MAEKPQEQIVVIAVLSIVSMILVVGTIILAKPGTKKYVQTSTDQSVQVSQKDSFNDSELRGTPDSNKLTTDIIGKNDSVSKGRVIFEEVSGKVLVSLELKDMPEKPAYPAFIYEGECSGKGRMLYSLLPVTGGKTENYMNGTISDFKKQFPLSLRVYGSSDNLSEFIACSDLGKA